MVASATPYRILKDLAEGCGSKLPKKGLSFEDGWGVVEDALRGKRALLVLDEIDKYVEKDPEAKVLYRLTRRPDTCLVLISNLQPAPLLDLIEEQKVRSRLAGTTRMNFLPYNAMHLKDIIHERVKLGALAAGTAEQGAVELCAALAVARQGDAAYALNLFEMAARTAESEGAMGLEIKHVKIADQIVEESHVREAINNMAPGKKLILLLLVQRGPTTPTEIYTRVGDQFSGALGKISRRWRAEYLRELQADGFVVNERVGKRSGRGGVGWKASISPSYDRKTLEAYLIEAMPGVKTDKEPGSNMYG